MITVSSCSCLCTIHWSQILSRERRCSWSSADRRCSNYIWGISNFDADQGSAYIRCFTVVVLLDAEIPWGPLEHCQYSIRGNESRGDPHSLHLGLLMRGIHVPIIWRIKKHVSQKILSKGTRVAVHKTQTIIFRRIQLPIQASSMFMISGAP